LFDPNLFLEIANNILTDKNYRDERGWRTAIGRAYYAAFLVTKKRLESLGNSFADVDRIHREVIQSLMQRNSGLANQLDQLREKRVAADYFMDLNITADLGQKCAKLSERVIGSVERLS